MILHKKNKHCNDKVHLKYEHFCYESLQTQQQSNINWFMTKIILKRKERFSKVFMSIMKWTRWKFNVIAIVKSKIKFTRMKCPYDESTAVLHMTSSQCIQIPASGRTCIIYKLNPCFCTKLTTNASPLQILFKQSHHNDQLLYIHSVCIILQYLH